MKQNPELILASASPRRLALIGQLGLVADVVSADIDESTKSNESVEEYVGRLALEKARSVQRSQTQLPVLAADTAIWFNGRIVGKPENLQCARDQLSMFAGKSHDVLTGTAIVYEEIEVIRVVRTTVLFRDLSPKEIDAYSQSGEPLGKAGGYAIQGLGAILVKEIRGSYSNVVGLPLCETAEMLDEVGIRLLNSDRYKH